MIKFADDTTVIGLVKDGNESAYREEARNLALWCEDSNRNLNPTKTRETIIDFRKSKSPMDSLCIDGQHIETVDSFKFVGNTTSNDLSWKANTNAIVCKAHQKLYFFRQLKKFGLKKKLLTVFFIAAQQKVYYRFPFVCQLTNNVIWIELLRLHRGLLAVVYLHLEP